MKTLVIHPQDYTTKFLNIIYKDKGYTVVTKHKLINARSIINKIKKHDRIMMMGHGNRYGLLGFNTLFMTKDFIEAIREKECVCIWCNADEYVLREGIKGFYTGMFISEVYEAKYFGIEVSQDDIDYSNYLFVGLMRDRIESPNVLTEIKSSYVGDCPIIRYNNERLYYRSDNTIVKIEKPLII